MTHAHRTLLKLARTLHVYLTLFGLALLVFFATTGFMLNHEDWFSSPEPTHIVKEGYMPREWLTPGKEDRLAIVEKLRADFGAHGEMESLTIENESSRISVIFKSPGYQADANIQLEDGQTTVDHQVRGLVGIMLDLHRGKTSGMAWKMIIDAVCVLFVIISITGLILWSSLRSRAQHGTIILALGIGVGLAVYLICVPR